MTDKQIWDDFKRGKGYALSHIYYQNMQLLYRYGKKFTHDNDLVMDTIQDLFYDLIRTRDKLGNTNNIKYYLIKSFRRKLFRNICKQWNQIEANTIEIEPTLVFSVEEDMIDREVLSQREVIIQEALKKLTPRMREILYYRYNCEFEYDYICEIMGIQYDSARKMVYKAIRELKSIFSEYKTINLFYLCFKRKGCNEDYTFCL
jgi:RNA polymerase sigma factor (sigma-70 family)